MKLVVIEVTTNPVWLSTNLYSGTLIGFGGMHLDNLLSLGIDIANGIPVSLRIKVVKRLHSRAARIAPKI